MTQTLPETDELAELDFDLRCQAVLTVFTKRRWRRAKVVTSETLCPDPATWSASGTCRHCNVMVRTFICDRHKMLAEAQSLGEVPMTRELTHRACHRRIQLGEWVRV